MKVVLVPFCSHAWQSSHLHSQRAQRDAVVKAGRQRSASRGSQRACTSETHSHCTHRQATWTRHDADATAGSTKWLLSASAQLRLWRFEVGYHSERKNWPCCIESELDSLKVKGWCPMWGLGSGIWVWLVVVVKAVGVEQPASYNNLLIFTSARPLY